jgi:hypothetical protein
VSQHVPIRKRFFYDHNSRIARIDQLMEPYGLFESRELWRMCIDVQLYLCDERRSPESGGFVIPESREVLLNLAEIGLLATRLKRDRELNGGDGGDEALAYCERENRKLAVELKFERDRRVRAEKELTEYLEREVRLVERKMRLARLRMGESEPE